MCRRNDPNGLQSVVESPTSLTLFDIESAFDDVKIDSVKYCGSNGDPLMAKEALPIFKYFSGKTQLIHTNGSLRSSDFWKKLGQIPKMTVYFALDGASQETLSQYRIGADFNKILVNAQTFIEAGGSAVWSMIKFKHNEHEIEDAKVLAEKLGFSSFKITHTRRFYNGDEFKYVYNGEIGVLNKPDNTFEESIIQNSKVHCKAKEDEEIYIDANGFVWPCTYLADSEFVRDNNERFNIKTRKYKDIVFDEYFDELNDSLYKNPIPCCVFNCQIKYKNKHELITL